MRRGRRIVRMRIPTAKKMKKIMNKDAFYLAYYPAYLGASLLNTTL
jgi:hypothetical protein